MGWSCFVVFRNVFLLKIDVTFKVIFLNGSCKLRLRITFVVNKDITVKSVPKQQDVFRVFKVDICSGEQVGIETV